eukprot:365760-Chlamydomonas_euryale.AAC.1
MPCTWELGIEPGTCHLRRLSTRQPVHSQWRPVGIRQHAPCTLPRSGSDLLQALECLATQLRVALGAHQAPPTPCFCTSTPWTTCYRSSSSVRLNSLGPDPSDPAIQATGDHNGTRLPQYTLQHVASVGDRSRLVRECAPSHSVGTPYLPFYA